MIKFGNYEPEFSGSDTTVGTNFGTFVTAGRKYLVQTPFGTKNLRAVEYKDITGLVRVGFYIPIFNLISIRVSATNNILIQNIAC